MTRDAVRSIADAVLYEGYILYPYRASSQKNQSRWQFGVIMAPAYAAADPSETSFSQYECVLEHAGSPQLTVLVRFLQVQRRTAGPGEAWDEAVECEVEFTIAPAALLGGGHTEEFTVPGGEDRDEEWGGTAAGAAGRCGYRSGHGGARAVAGTAAADPGGEPG